MPVQSPFQLVVPEYVASPCPRVWNMSELGDVSLWTDNGETAAFSVQLGLICERILQRNNALPPLTAILFFFRSDLPHSKRFYSEKARVALQVRKKEF